MPTQKKPEGFQLPADLSALSGEELDTALTTATAEVDALLDDENLDATGLARATELGEHITTMRGESDTRTQAAAELAAGREALRAQIHGTEGDDDDAGDGDAEGDSVDGNITAPALVASGRKKTDVRDVIKSGNRLNVKLSEAAARQQPQNIPVDTPFDASVLVASADIPGFTQGGQIHDMVGLAKAYQQRARSLPIGRALAGGEKIYGDYMDTRTGKMTFGLLGHQGDYRGTNRVPVAAMQRNYRHMLNDMSSPEEAWKIMQEAANPNSLIASGGWCSPSEIRYDFYNTVQMDGAVDLPTTGINRGGIKFPTSPSFGDLAASLGLWHWNETQDIAAATGTAQSGSKTCAHVPCAAFNEVRLEGEGICITAGNLSTDAWPEQLSNYLRLVNAAHFHRINTYFINQLIAQSTAVTLTQTNGSPITDLLAGVEHQVWDLRTKYAMADTDVLEVILPSWLKGTLRADVSRRSGMASADNSFDISDAQMAAWFTRRYVSVQFVQDFDVRAANQFGQASATALQGSWPTVVRFLIFPAGTWLRGNGLNLDLGIIRDSTLNATNDYTAAWSEEFFLLAKIGNESRIVTLGASGNVPTGTTAVGLTATGV